MTAEERGALTACVEVLRLTMPGERSAWCMSCLSWGAPTPHAADCRGVAAIARAEAVLREPAQPAATADAVPDYDDRGELGAANDALAGILFILHEHGVMTGDNEAVVHEAIPDMVRAALAAQAAEVAALRALAWATGERLHRQREYTQQIMDAANQATRDLHAHRARLYAERDAALADVARLTADRQQGCVDYLALRDHADALQVKVARLTAKLQNAAVEHGEAIGQLRRAKEERDAALRERDEARVSTTLLHHVRVAREQERRRAAEQVRETVAECREAIRVTGAMISLGTFEVLADRIAAGPQPGEEE